jgi:hypothetical protein
MADSHLDEDRIHRLWQAACDRGAASRGTVAPWTPPGIHDSPPRKPLPSASQSLSNRHESFVAWFLGSRPQGDSR